MNFTEGGLGPNENAEGNTLLAREEVSRHFGAASLPAIVVESKAFVPAYCQDLSSRSLLTRINSAVDNTVVAEALIAGAQAYGLPMAQDFNAYPRNQALKQQTAAFGVKLKALGESLTGAEQVHPQTCLTGQGHSFSSSAIQTPQFQVTGWLLISTRMA
ncbi:MAG: hypothetical protein EHM38_00100 [Geobacteraceae bacterium]|nr:MAG: hypothetical protein EHM38_00100 [Geobacteraceae bacterium]